MTELFLFLFHRLEIAIGAGGLFLCVASLLTVLFAIALILVLWFKKSNYKSRLWFLIISMIILCLHVGIEYQFSINGFWIFSILLAILYNGVIFYIPIRSYKYNDQHLEFARMLLDSAKNKVDIEHEEIKPNNNRQVLPSIIVKENENHQKGYDKEIDFAHVKNVISRLDYYGLNQSDKRQVKELETAIFEAENYQMTNELKCRINDGLGALLKIMSKYGI